jgi:hypothetical protein
VSAPNVLRLKTRPVVLKRNPTFASRYNYQVACCESLAGRTDDAIEYLREAIDKWEGCRDMAKEDSDFDLIRDEPAFQDLVGR